MADLEPSTAKLEEHALRVWRLGQYLNAAVDAGSFEAAAADISDALYQLSRWNGVALADDEFLPLGGALDGLRCATASWPEHAYQNELELGLDAAGSLLAAWCGLSVNDPQAESFHDHEAHARILRNAAHNVVLQRILTERAHRRRECNIHSLLAARRSRGLA